MKTVRYDPTKALFPWEDRLARWFAFDPWRDLESIEKWTPTADIYESDKAYVIKVELPEVEKKDVHVNLEGNILTIRGERRREREVDERHYHRSERYYGTFSRSFVIPGAVEREQIKATCREGVLSVELPKRAEARPKEITVEAA